MKTLLRTLIIMAAALVVVGGLYAFRQSALGQSFASAGPGGREGRPAAGVEGAPAAGLPAGERPDGLAGREGHGGHGPSLFGLVEVGKNLTIVAVSVTLVALGARLLRLGRRDGPGPASPLSSE